MKLNKNIIKGFVSSYLLSKYDDPSPIPDFHMELWDLWCSGARRTAIAAPRGFAKTTAIGGYLLACIAFRHKKFIVLCSDTLRVAIPFLGDITEELGTNEKLRKDFGIVDFDTESKMEIICKFKDGHSAKIIAAGAGQQLRGVIKSHAKPDLFIGDDLENDKEVASDEQSSELKRWLTRTVMPLVSAKGQVHLVGTIIGQKAMLESLMPENITPEDEKEEHLHSDGVRTFSTFPGSWKSVRYQAHNFPSFTKFLWEERYNATYLREALQAFQEQGDEEGYYREYLNRPITSRLGFLPTDRIKLVPYENIVKLLTADYPAQLICAVDFAASEKSSADETAFLVGVLSENNDLYLMDLVHGRFSSTDIIDLILSLARQYSKYNIKFIAERGALYNIYARLLVQEGSKRGVPISIDDIPINGANKAIRAKAIQHRLKTGTLYAPEGTTWLGKWKEQLDKFSAKVTDESYKKKNMRDDIVDTTSLLCDRVYTSSLFEDEDDDQDSDGTYYETGNSGRSIICGY